MFGLLATSLLSLSVVAQMEYAGNSGLQFQVLDIPLIQGSSFQYYERGWTRGIYSSNWSPLQIARDPSGDTHVRYSGDNGQATGSLLFSPQSDGFIAEYNYRWRGDMAVRIETCFAMLWAPAILGSELTVDGVPIALNPRPPQAGLGAEQRIVARGNRFVFDMPFFTAEARIEGGPVVLFDARGHRQPWAEKRHLFWLGILDADIGANSELYYRVRWTITEKPIVRVGSGTQNYQPGSDVQVVTQPSEKHALPLVPQPKRVQPGSGWASVAGGLIGADEASVVWADWVQSRIQGIFRWAPEGDPITLRTTQRAGIPAEGYVLEVRTGEINLDYADARGLRHGLNRLVNLVQPFQRSLGVREVRIEDHPSVSWRGVHFFSGPGTYPFHERLTQRVLAPMFFNRVVSQAERANWRTLPGIETFQTIDRAELRQKFAMYRAEGLEPIPLIQSLGHMGWIFANNQNKDIALNPEVPFTVDPRRGRTREVLNALWDEVIEELQPTTVHMGLDEFNMRGVARDASFSTRLWTQHVPFLSEIARRHRVDMMVWSDIMLGPGEAIDAMNAEDGNHARQRRQVLPRGTYVADWHYADNPNPEAYRSLELWQREGFRPIASNWFRPNNIRGHTLAAARNGSGVLQTTWAGYTTDWVNLIREPEQFAAYILAGDYAWSARQELPQNLPYDAHTLLRHVMTRDAEPTAQIRGRRWVIDDQPRQEEFVLESFRFDRYRPLMLRSVLNNLGVSRSANKVFDLQGADMSDLIFLIDNETPLNDGQEIAVVTVTFTDGTERSFRLLYGAHVRAEMDPRPTVLTPRRNGLSAWRLRLADSPRGVREVMMRTTEPTAGIRIHGISSY